MRVCADAWAESVGRRGSQPTFPGQTPGARFPHHAPAIALKQARPADSSSENGGGAAGTVGTAAPWGRPRREACPRSRRPGCCEFPTGELRRQWIGTREKRKDRRGQGSRNRLKRCQSALSGNWNGAGAAPAGRWGLSRFRAAPHTRGGLWAPPLVRPRFDCDDCGISLVHIYGTAFP
jgi:hypothetical protein